MVEAQDASRDNAQEEKTALAKIKPVKIEATSTDVESSNFEDEQIDGRIELERSLISATILLLR